MGGGGKSGAMVYLDCRFVILVWFQTLEIDASQFCVPPVQQDLTQDFLT